MYLSAGRRGVRTGGRTAAGWEWGRKTATLRPGSAAGHTPSRATALPVRHGQHGQQRPPQDQRGPGVPFGGPGQPTVADLGCGPGHVAAWLAGHGAKTVGVDLSDAMVEVGRHRCPTVEFRQGDLLELPVKDGEFGSAFAFYAVIRSGRRPALGRYGAGREGDGRGR
ncbi:class I SAM-dependent methyltransferase [Streptomyces sp. NPDC058000]|uniref:class I SAM-dependent methyltransferase n=1 Tax=Streptomyces sp. NPDC058000 TaxID=3346299 RepID=UPI0036EA4171